MFLREALVSVGRLLGPISLAHESSVAMRSVKGRWSMLSVIGFHFASSGQLCCVVGAPGALRSELRVPGVGQLHAA